MPTSDHPAEPEYLGQTVIATSERSPRRRMGFLVLAAAAVGGVVGAGTWAALSLMSTGDQPAAAVPASAVVYASLDLDPSAAQKLEAISIIKKFPSLDEELGLDLDDDLRRWAFEEGMPDRCTGVDYDDEVAPWIGDRMAFAALPGEAKGDEPVPMVALAVTDEKAAAAGLDELTDCAPAVGPPEGGDFGYAFVDGYVVIAETTETAERLAEAASEGTLAEDGTFRRWTEEAGDAGFATAYVAPEAVAVLADVARDDSHGGSPGMPFGPGLGPGFGPGLGSGADQLEALAGEFEGLAAVLRFSDGAVEVEVAGGGVPESYALDEGRATGVDGLPATTGAVLALALPEGWARSWVDSMDDMMGMPLDPMLAEAEKATGLEIPADLERLFGESISVVVDGSIDATAVEEPDDLSALPVGVRVEGDPDEILPVVERIRAAWGPESEAMVVETGDGSVAFGTDPDYVAGLADDGSLGDEDSFRGVVPHADRAGAVMYVDFETGDAWLERVVAELSRTFAGPADTSEVHRNMDALDAMGAGMWVEDGVVRGLFRLTTD